MENKKTNDKFKTVWDSLTDEQKARAKNCKTVDDLLAFAKNEKIELPDEVLDDISGGIQAKQVTDAGQGEFGTTKQETTEKRPTWF